MSLNDLKHYHNIRKLMINIINQPMEDTLYKGCETKNPKIIIEDKNI